MISYLLARLRFKVTPPIEFEFEFYSVRLSEDMPDFKAVIVVDKYARCFSRGPILMLEGAEMQSWYINKSKNDLPDIHFVIAGRIFNVSKKDSVEVFNYFMNTFPHLWKSNTL